MEHNSHNTYAIRNEAAMNKRNVMMVSLITLITFVLGAGAAVRRHEDSQIIKLRQLAVQLEQTEVKLAVVTGQLSDANKKLAFLDASKARVQVTAYALTDDFGPDPFFSNNTPARSAYAVPKHALPASKVLNVALSPVAERKLHAHLNDTIVLVSQNQAHRHIARFVDRTAQSETRSVVDILFADAHEARLWGRRSFYAVDISQTESPFQQQ